MMHQMNILVLGDVFGRPGREMVKKFVPEIKKEYKIDFAVANVENLSHGKGFTKNTVEELRKAGVDFFTSGNHVWKQKSDVPHLNEKDFPVIRPANYPPGVPGRGWQIVETGMMKRILVINLLGRVFMPDHADDPFRAADEILEKTKHQHLDAIIIDLHAEVTSEKWAMAHYLDGRVSLIYGTHTHVPTADARILEGGTAFITDVGMTGPYDSIIGLEKKGIIRRFRTQLPEKHEVAEGDPRLNAIVVTISPKTRKAEKIIQIMK